MKICCLSSVLLGCVTFMATTGCMNAPGKPMPDSEAPRPEAVLNPTVLYKQNCAGCHGDHGQSGAAISLANPTYLATAGAGNIRRITAEGVAGTMMPGFGKEHGGFLTDEQIGLLSQGMLDAWARPVARNGQLPPAYASAEVGDSARGEKAFAVSCARCHGANGTGGALNSSSRLGSIVDPSYLALISDQGLRSIIISGSPEKGMPDWRNDIQGRESRAITEQEMSDIVAWLAAHRIRTPGQPYPGLR